jgi:hypothetical protein
VHGSCTLPQYVAIKNIVGILVLNFTQEKRKRQRFLFVFELQKAARSKNGKQQSRD